MKRLSLLLFLILACASVFAQRVNNKKKNSAEDLPLSERVFFGGGGGFSSGIFPNGYRYTYISASPLMGYRVTMPFAVGLGVNYSTYRFQGGIVPPINQYGLSPFAQYRFGKLFAYGEWSIINAAAFDRPGRAVYQRLPVGLGFTQPLGPKVAINGLALYDVLYNSSSFIFPSPWILRVYFTAGGISF